MPTGDAFIAAYYRPELVSPQPMSAGRWLDDFLALPGRVRWLLDIVGPLTTQIGRIEMVGEQTSAAIAELRGAIDEVAAEMDALDAKLVEGATVDAETANAIRPMAARLRALRPEATDPAPPPS
jgi:hypothetical protein